MQLCNALPTISRLPEISIGGREAISFFDSGCQWSISTIALAVGGRVTNEVVEG
jgi:hypothetical protein